MPLLPNFKAMEMMRNTAGVSDGFSLSSQTKEEVEEMEERFSGLAYKANIA